eukprot:6212356-Pleurochrysis_carterae.AAC.2
MMRPRCRHWVGEVCPILRAPTVNAARVTEIANRVHAAVDMFRRARAAGRMQVALGYGVLLPLHVPSLAWPALRRVSGVARALALASLSAVVCGRRGPVVRVLREGALLPSLRQRCLRLGPKHGNQRTIPRLDESRVRSCRSEPFQINEVAHGGDLTDPSRRETGATLRN